MKKYQHEASRIRMQVLESRKHGKKFKIPVSEVSDKTKAELKSQFTFGKVYEVRIYFPPRFQPRRSTHNAVKNMFEYQKKNKGNIRRLELQPEDVDALRKFGMSTKLVEYVIY
jgi:hypothetical protein